MELALDKGMGGARQRGDEVHEDRDRGDAQIEQEFVAGLVGVQRVRQDPALRHEHVGRKDRTQDQRERSGDIEKRGQQSKLRREERRDRRAGGRVDRVAGCGQRRRGHQDEAQYRRTDDGRRGEDRPAFVGEVGLDGDREAEQAGGDEVQQRQCPSPGVFRLVAQQEREQPGQKEAQREAVTEPGPPQQVGRPEAQPAGRPDGTGQVPGSVEALAPAVRGSDRLGAGADAVEQHPESPDELEATAPFAPLVEQGEREHEGQHGGQGRQDDAGIHGQAAVS